MEPTISIALCTYNGGKFLQRQINSFLNQTVLPDEVVVCDDGSGDHTLSIVRQFITDHPEIQWNLVENKTNLGASKNFEKAISLCKGDLIFLSDQDDIWSREKIAQTISYFDRNADMDAGFSNASLIDDEGRLLPGTLLDTTIFKPGVRGNYKKEDLLYWTLLFGNLMTGATMAIRRTALPDILPFHLDLGRELWHDGWISLSLLSNGRIQYIDQTLMQYRVHAMQQVGVVVRDDPFEKYLFLHEYHEGFKKEYFQRYLSAFSTMRELKKIKPPDPSVEKRITREYLDHREKYFKSQSFSERKLRLLKWYLQGVNFISFRDLMTL
jgi:glycosyltransferase involved in cell wall biosynthesis